MNELLGWYGYDKVDSQDTKSLDLARYKSENPGSDDSGDELSREDNCSENGEIQRFRPDAFRDETSLAAQHRNLVNALKKRCTEKSGESSEEGTSSRFILCAWCQKPGVKLFTLKTETCTKAFCSEVCFSQCRRASFKKNKMCDWCKHVRPTVNYVDFQDGDQQYQFCTEKCLNQYKMNIFCREAREHLEKIKSGEKGESPENREKVMITPELWLKNKGKVKMEESERKHVSKSSSSHRSDKTEHRSILGSKLFHSGREHKPSESSSREREKTKSRTQHVSTADSLKSPQPPSGSSSGTSLFGTESMPWLLPNGQVIGPMLPPYAHLHHLMCSGLLPPHLVNMLTTGGLPDLFQNPPKGGGRNVSSTPGSQLNSPGSDNGVKVSPTGEHFVPQSQYSSTRREAQRTPGNLPLHSAFPPLNPPLTVPPDVSAYNSQPGRQFPQQDLQNLGLPPVTMMLPLPVALPVPVPIPIPIPLTMDQIKTAINWKDPKEKVSVDDKSKFAVFEEKAKEGKMPPLSPHTPHSINTGSCISFNSPRSEQSSPNSVLSDSLSSSEKPLNLHSPRSQVEGIPLPARFRFSSRLSNTSPNEVIDLSKDSATNVHKIEKHKDEKEDDLSNDSDKRCESDRCDEAESGKIPLIHIIPSKPEPSLADPLPLPPIEQSYSSRRGLILDAPVVPKRKRSPSPVSDRRVYSRITRDIMEAAKRRALRARLKTK